MLSKWKKQEEKTQKVENMMLNMYDIEFKLRIDSLTYWILDDVVRENTIDDCKINLDTNQFIANLCNRTLKDFILNHQYLLTEKLNREISMIDDKLDGKEIKLEDIFKRYTL